MYVTGEDDCGVCGGDNSTCLDCANIPNGKKVVDLCENCLLPDDPSLNANCTELGSFTPAASYKSGGTEVKITGSGMSKFSSVSCQFNSRAQRYNFLLDLPCVTLKSGQTYFKNPAVFKPQDF